MTDEPDEFALLVADIKRRMAELDAAKAQPAVAKAQTAIERRRANNAQVLAKAMALQAEGRISDHDLVRLQALRAALESLEG